MPENDSKKYDLSEFQIVTRHIVMEKDLNAFGNLFGGAMLAWLDEASALFVMDQIGYDNFVTVSMHNINFKTPGRRGNAIVIYSRVESIGKSSITVETRAYVHEPETAERREIITCTITFVCLRKDRPFPYFTTDKYRDWLKRRDSF